MGITQNEMYKKLKWGLEHLAEATDDYNREKTLVTIWIIVFTLLGFSIGFIVKARNYL
jgi:hypothetical protein